MRCTLTVSLVVMLPHILSVYVKHMLLRLQCSCMNVSLCWVFSAGLLPAGALSVAIHVYTLSCTCAPSCAEQAVQIQNGNYHDHLHTKMMAFVANNISSLALHEHILFNVVPNVGMQSTQVGGTCDDDIPEQFSSNLYISHTTGKSAEPSLLLLKRASDHHCCSKNYKKQRPYQQSAA